MKTFLPLDLRIPAYPFNFRYQFTDLLMPNKIGKRVVRELKSYRESLPSEYYQILSEKYSSIPEVLNFVQDMECN